MNTRICIWCTVDREIFTVENFPHLLWWQKLNTKFFQQWAAISVHTYVYLCAYRMKVASYTGFHLKCHIENHNFWCCTVLKLHIHELFLVIHRKKIVTTLPGGENKMHKNLHHKNFSIYGMILMQYALFGLQQTIHEKNFAKNSILWFPLRN